MEESMTEIFYPIQMSWKISEGSLKEALNYKNGKIVTNTFDLTPIPGARYTGMVFPNGPWENQGKLVIALSILNHENKVEADISCSIISANYFSKLNPIFGHETIEAFGYLPCTAFEFFHPRNNFIVDGQLSLEIEGVLKIQKAEKNLFIITKFSLAEHLWNADDKDFIIEVNGKFLRAHKLILAHRSPMFAAMFQSGMKEAIENRTKITDFTFEVVDAAIKFFYDQNYELTVSLASSLLQFADKYQILDLKENMETYLIEKISVSNVCKIVNETIDSNSEELSEKCMDFLLDCLKYSVPVCGINDLNDEFSSKLLKKSFRISIVS